MELKPLYLDTRKRVRVRRTNAILRKEVLKHLWTCPFTAYELQTLVKVPRKSIDKLLTDLESLGKVEEFPVKLRYVEEGEKTKKFWRTK